MCLRLRWAIPSTLIRLLLSTGNRLEGHLFEHNTDHREEILRSRPLLTPECLPYAQPIFSPFENTILSTSLSKKSKTNEKHDAVVKIRPIREIVELPAPDIMNPFTAYR